MAYYDDRRYYSPRDRYAHPASYVDPYNDPRGGYARRSREAYYPRRSDDSVEEVQRDYPPGEDYVYERGYNARRSRRPVYERVRRASSVGGHDPYYGGADYRSQPRRSRYDDRDGRRRRSRYSPPESISPSPPRHRRRKSFSEQALGALGLGAATSSRGDRDHDSDRGRSYSRRRPRYSGSPSYSRSRSRDQDRDQDRDRGRRRHDRSEQRLAQAARAALAAGAVEAFKLRKEPGAWTGDKGKRILTVAAAAGGTDGLIDKDPNRHETRHVIESTLAGLATNHFVNGGRSKSQDRGQNRSSSGVKGLAASGALAAAGKEIWDRYSRSRSRPRGRGDSPGSDNDDRRGAKKRSKSVSDYISKGMAALGLDEHGAGKDRDEPRESRRERRHRRSPQDDEYSDSDADSDYGRDSRRDRGSRDVRRFRSSEGSTLPPRAPNSAPRGGGDGAGSVERGTQSGSESDSDLGSSSDEKKQRRKIKRSMLFTMGLASVATIHAAHELYEGVERGKKRRKELAQGEITHEEARKLRTRATAKDALSVGVAAIGVHGAYKEWKELHEMRMQNKHFREECAKREAKREQRRSRSHGSVPDRRHRWPDEIECPPSVNDSWHDAPHYHDGNPYGATEQAQITY